MDLSHLNDEDYDKGVAFGCLTFEQLDLAGAPGPDSGSDLRQWADDVERALGSIPSVNEIAVQVPTGGTTLGTTRRAGRSKTWLEGPSFIPHPRNGSVSFSVTIPHRAQPDLFRGRSALNSELFHVHITYAGLFPVTVVLSDRPERIPAQSMVIVREFLIAQLELHKGPRPITVGGLGPSPLPIDGYVRLGVESPNEMVTRYRLEKREGRSFLKIRSETTDATALVADIADSCHSELGLYYLFVERRNDAMTKSVAVENKIRDLVALHRKRTPFAWAKRLATSGQSATLISLDVLEQRRSREIQIEGLERLRDREAERTGFGYFMELLDETIESISQISADASSPMVDLINNRHTRSVQVVSVVAASLLGGVAGAAITAAAQLQS